jgi:DNA (cytosine-5)-methyltransferase 1
VRRPFLVDLYCCGGGAGMGLHRAGFNVVGVDKEKQPHYPFPFLQADVLELDVEWLASFDAIWASPPCQAHTRNARQKGTAHLHPDLIAGTRELLEQTGRPWCMENVADAPLRADLMLCGSMFGLRIVRHRIFEVSGFEVEQPEHGQHHPDYITVTGHPGGSSKRDGGRHFGGADEWREVMGIDWLPASKVKEAVPPAYSEFIGRAMGAALEMRTVA